MVSPLMIRMAMAHHYTAAPASDFHPAQWDSPAGLGARKWLRDSALVDDDNQPTPKLRVYVEHLCSQPLPQVRYVTEGIATEGEGEP